MAVSSDYLAYVLEQLGELEAVSARRMFGGVGLYCDELFFGLIDDDTLYLRADADSRDEFTARGMRAFRPYADRPLLSMSYYEAPAEVLEDRALLASWVRRSLAVAAKKSARPRARRRRRAR